MTAPAYQLGITFRAEPDLWPSAAVELAGMLARQLDPLSHGELVVDDEALARADLTVEELAEALEDAANRPLDLERPDARPVTVDASHIWHLDRSIYTLRRP